MFTKNEKEKLLQLVSSYGPLTESSIKAFFLKTRNKAPDETGYFLRKLEQNNEVFIDTNIVKLFPGAKIDTKRISAFWTYIAFAKETEEKMFKAKYPSQIGFVNNKVCIITICEDPYEDKEMIALREKEADDVFNIIGGYNLKLDEIKKELLPAKPFIFAEISVKNIAADTPKITFTKVDESENEK